MHHHDPGQTTVWGWLIELAAYALTGLGHFLTVAATTTHDALPTLSYAGSIALIALRIRAVVREERRKGKGDKGTPP
jgi:hypothetical protein